jgi:hypothetical protein
MSQYLLNCCIFKKFTIFVPILIMLVKIASNILIFHIFIKLSIHGRTFFVYWVCISYVLPF